MFSKVKKLQDLAGENLCIFQALHHTKISSTWKDIVNKFVPHVADIQNILNDLTIYNYQEIGEELYDFLFDSNNNGSKVKVTLKIIFWTALEANPEHSEALAKMCGSFLSADRYTKFDSLLDYMKNYFKAVRFDAVYNSFKRTLLNYCHTKFKRDCMEDLDTDDAEKKFLANIRFIVNFYQNTLVDHNYYYSQNDTLQYAILMHDIIKDLLCRHSTRSEECLSWLLTKTEGLENFVKVLLRLPRAKQCLRYGEEVIIYV